MEQTLWGSEGVSMVRLIFEIVMVLVCLMLGGILLSKQRKHRAFQRIEEEACRNIVISKLNDPFSLEISRNLEAWLQEKPYLKTGLKLREVSEQTGIPVRKLSEFIHLRYNLTFNSWVNTLRIEEVKCILSDPLLKNKTLSEITDETGFVDLARMSNVFKQINGISPSDYRKKVRDEMQMDLIKKE